MAKKKKAPVDGEEAPKKGKKKIVLLLVLVLLIGGGGAGYMFLMPKPKPVSAAELAAKPGPVVVLPQITTNLADGHYLQVTIALQETMAPGTAPDVNQVTNTAILYLGSDTMNGLLAPGAKQRAEAGLLALIDKLYPKKVSKVYFTQFLMQS